MFIRALLAAGAASNRQRIRRLLAGCEVVLESVSRRGALWEELSKEEFDFLFIDRTLLSDSPEALIDSVRTLPMFPEVVVLSKTEDPEDRALLQAAGCLAVVNLALDDSILRDVFVQLVRRRQEDMTTRLLADRPEERYSLNDFVSTSPAMQVFLETVRRVVDAGSALLILGETGVGKERLARAIHAEGARSSGPFMAVNCSALVESLLESELFGHEEGAFTGATRSRRGYVELAHRGTLFLDEIGELPHHLQIKLLRVLEEKKIQRVGGENLLAVDVRIMAATNRDLEADVAAGRFRADLYYRLAVVTLTLPPLRERREDIPLLAKNYLNHFRLQTKRNVRGIRPEVMTALRAYEWPGNVRELINAVEQGVLLCKGQDITLEDIPSRVRISSEGGSGRGPLPAPGRGSGGSLPDGWFEKTLSGVRREILDRVEQEYLHELLKRTGGRIGETAKRAGISERSLYNLMRRHGLRKEDFRRG